MKQRERTMREDDRRNDQNYCSVPCCGLWLLCCSQRLQTLKLLWNSAPQLCNLILDKVLSSWKPQSEKHGHFPGGRSSACCVLDGVFRWLHLWLWFSTGEQRSFKATLFMSVYAWWWFRRQLVCVHVRDGAVGIDLIGIHYISILSIYLWANF